MLVWRFYDHKCRHGVMFRRRGALQRVKRPYESLLTLNETNALFIVGLIVLVSSCRDVASQHSKGRNFSVTRLRYSANHNALDSWPIRAHLASQNDELCKNQRVSEGGA